VRLALYQPDIPQNLGAAIRIAACFGVSLDIIEPCGFPLTDKTLKRTALDYQAATTRHASWAAFCTAPERAKGRLVLLTTKGATALPAFVFAAGDTLLMGRESAGVPDDVHDAAQARVRVPLSPGSRSLNVAVTAGIALYEGLRQTGALEG
jgi:tRNA (cytidine/uridine-2'-O-)-methyltransferase